MKEKLFLNIIKAVYYLHSNRVIHGDIKQSNIMIGDCGQIKLIDFGLSTIVWEKKQPLCYFRGSPYYMSPEIISETPYDGRGY